ncbi:hypothetical protein [Salinispira pacifica]
MATEIEVKAWVRNPDGLTAQLDKTCEFEKSYVKKDIYLHGPAGRPEDSWAHWDRTGPDSRAVKPQDFRLRIEEGETTCTFKERTLHDGLEVNREAEFSVSDPRLFLELAARIGCRVFSCKVKEGRRYRFRGTRPLVAELSTIAGLGRFIEVECVVPSDSPSPEETAATLGLIRDFLQQLGVPESDIESRPYARLLAEAGINQCTSIQELDGIEFGTDE